MLHISVDQSQMWVKMSRMVEDSQVPSLIKPFSVKLLPPRVWTLVRPIALLGFVNIALHI